MLVYFCTLDTTPNTHLENIFLLLEMRFLGPKRDQNGTLIHIHGIRNIRCFFFSLFIAAPIDVLMLMTPGHHTNVSHTNVMTLFPSFATSFVRLLGRLREGGKFMGYPG